MKKLCCLTMTALLFFCLVLCISAESNENSEEKMVRDIVNSGPQVESVINKTKDSLTESEKFSYCLDKFMVSEGTPFDVFIKGEIFSEEYHKMFGEEFELVPGKEYEYEGSLSYISKDYGHTVLYAITEQSYIKYVKSVSSGEPYLGYYKHFIDYELSDDCLTVNIGLLIIDPNNANDDEKAYLEDIKLIASGQADMNGDSLWEKHSDLYTVYTMTYQKGSDGEWYWVLCTLSNPDTNDKDGSVNIMLLIASAVTCVLIPWTYLKKDKNTVHHN